MTTKERLHKLVDELSKRDLRAAERYLEYLTDTSDPRRPCVSPRPIG